MMKSHKVLSRKAEKERKYERQKKKDRVIIQYLTNKNPRKKNKLLQANISD